MKTSSLIILGLGVALSGCAPMAVIPMAVVGGGTYEGITQTRPDDPDPADTASQIPEHNSWCYETMGYAECYAHAQDVDANRLINVDPASLYPLTPQAYRDAATADRSASRGHNPALTPVLVTISWPYP